MRPRSLLRGVALATLALALVIPSAASAQTPAELKARLNALKAQAADAGRAFDRAYWRLDETEVRLDKTNARIAATSKELKRAKRQLNKRANHLYRQGDVDFIDFLLGADSFEEFAARVDYLQRVGVADAEVVAKVTTLRAKLVAEQARLSRERKARSASVNQLKGERDKLQGRLRTTQGEYEKVRAQLDAVRSGGARPTGIAAMPGPNGMVFPVAGPNYYADTWGASRSGGRRRHKGTDIMAPTGTPCVAVLSGTVSARNGGLGGKTIWLTADNGWQFYYAHLNSWSVTSGRVQAGQVIGTVGYTGNAAASAPHLHFEIHPGGGAAVNPYPYLRSME